MDLSGRVCLGKVGQNDRCSRHDVCTRPEEARLDETKVRAAPELLRTIMPGSDPSSSQPRPEVVVQFSAAAAGNRSETFTDGSRNLSRSCLTSSLVSCRLVPVTRRPVMSGDTAVKVPSV